MQKRDMKPHVTFVGALHIGFGILGLLGALSIYILFNFALDYVDQDPLAQRILFFAGNTLTLIIIFFSSLGIIGGAGILSYRSWARILLLVVSAFNCLNFPIGTAKGIYSIWVLMQSETIEMFEQND